MQAVLLIKVLTVRFCEMIVSITTFLPVSYIVLWPVGNFLSFDFTNEVDRNLLSWSGLVVYFSVITAFWRQRQKDQQFEARVRPNQQNLKE